MKSLIPSMLIGALLISVSSLQAQSLLKFHARIGTSASNFSSKNSISKNASFGLLVGGGAEYSFTTSLKAIASLDYHQLKGVVDASTIATSEYTAVTENKATIHMAELTVAGAYKLPLTFLGDLAPYITAGGSIGYNLFTENTETVEYIYPTYSYETVGNDNVTSEYTQYLYSLQGGVRFEIPLSEGIFSGLLFDFRYRRNMNAVSEGLSAFSTTTDPADKYSNSVMASIGLQF